ncbi:MAG: cobalamin-dependent protein [Colwellia sp.]|nr:cobalamin-dependent protein [Colwellia sp.]
MKQVVLAMTESDAHVVGNKLLEVFLDESGFRVNNRGACTPLREVFIEAAKEPTLAIVLCSQNGHAREDIEGLKALKAEYNVNCPIVLGGNLSVGSTKVDNLHEQFRSAGVDLITNEFTELKIALEDMLMLSTEQEVAYA